MNNSIDKSFRSPFENMEHNTILGFIINSSRDAIFSKDINGIISTWNPAAERIFGYTSGEILGKSISILIPSYLQKEETEIMEKIRNGILIDYFETERIRKDGKTISVSLTISPIINSSGKIIGASKIARDITEQKKIKQELVKANKEKEMVLNRISDGVVSVDREWRYTFLNDAALATHPFSREDTLGKVIWDVHPEMEGTVFWDKYHEAMSTQKTLEIESHYAPMDIWFSVKVYPSSDGLTIFYKDITEGKKAEQSLEKSLKETSDYKYAIDESSIVAITDQKGIILHANENFCKISKYSLEELIGQDHRIINSGYHPKEFIRDLWVTIAHGKIWKGELKNKAKDGTIYWVDTTIVPFLNEQGKPYQYVAIRADITQRKQTEEQYSHNIKELERSNKELEQFAYIASHDLQEPLRMVGSYMQLIERRYKGKLDRDADEFIHFAVDGANRMKQLIGDLLNYSRMNKEGIIALVDMNEVLKEVKQNVSASIKESNGTVNYTDLPTIEADRTQMVQLFQNLISNAIKFAKTGIAPVITINVERQNSKWLFSISDNGIGIEQQYSEKVFIIFKQLHTKAKYGGTGIGLAIAKKIVERHGGKIWFESESGKGTTFYFTLNTKI